MTSDVPLLPTLSPRRGPCQDRWTTWPRAKLSARSTSAHDAPTVPFGMRPGHLCEKRDADTARGMSTRTSYSTRRQPRPAHRLTATVRNQTDEFERPPPIAPTHHCPTEASSNPIPLPDRGANLPQVGETAKGYGACALGAPIVENQERRRSLPLSMQGISCPTASASRDDRPPVLSAGRAAASRPQRA